MASGLQILRVITLTSPDSPKHANGEVCIAPVSDGLAKFGSSVIVNDAMPETENFDVSHVEESLRSIEQKLAEAWVKGDRSFIEQTLGDDWSVTDLTGRVLTKNDVLREAFGSDDRKVSSMKIDDIAVRPFGDWAIVTGRTRAAGEYQGQVVEVTLRFTDVFVVRDGRWQAVVSQATLLGE